MTALVFLQVLEPFCPQSEQENWEPEELEISLPAFSAAVPPPLPTDLNCASLPCDSSPPTQKDKEADVVSVGLISSVSDADCATPSSPPPPPLSPPASPSPLPDATSASQQCSASVSPLCDGPSDPQPETLLADDDSVVLQKTQSELIVVPLSSIPSDESNCTPDIT